jgi:hypothetical protein
MAGAQITSANRPDKRTAFGPNRVPPVSRANAAW